MNVDILAALLGVGIVLGMGCAAVILIGDLICFIRNRRKK